MAAQKPDEKVEACQRLKSLSKVEILPRDQSLRLKNTKGWNTKSSMLKHYKGHEFSCQKLKSTPKVETDRKAESFWAKVDDKVLRYKLAWGSGPKVGVFTTKV